MKCERKTWSGVSSRRNVFGVWGASDPLAGKNRGCELPIRSRDRAGGEWLVTTKSSSRCRPQRCVCRGITPAKSMRNGSASRGSAILEIRLICVVHQISLCFYYSIVARHSLDVLQVGYENKERRGSLPGPQSLGSLGSLGVRTRSLKQVMYQTPD
jgi:hypothetical protein